MLPDEPMTTWMGMAMETLRMMVEKDDKGLHLHDLHFLNQVVFLSLGSILLKEAKMKLKAGRNGYNFLLQTGCCRKLRLPETHLDFLR